MRLARTDVRGTRLPMRPRGQPRPDASYWSAMRPGSSSWKAKLVLDRHPRLAFEAVRIPKVWDVVAGLLTGEVAHPSEARGLARPSLRLLARLGG